MTYQLRPVAYYRRTFDGSRGLFDSCWRQYRAFLRGDIDNPTRDDDVINWLDHIAAEKVNTSTSKFYIHG